MARVTNRDPIWPAYNRPFSWPHTLEPKCTTQCAHAHTYTHMNNTSDRTSAKQHARKGVQADRSPIACGPMGRRVAGEKICVEVVARLQPRNARGILGRCGAGVDERFSHNRPKPNGISHNAPVAVANGVASLAPKSARRQTSTKQRQRDTKNGANPSPALTLAPAPPGRAATLATPPPSSEPACPTACTT